MWGGGALETKIFTSEMFHLCKETNTAGRPQGAAILKTRFSDGTWQLPLDMLALCGASTGPLLDPYWTSTGPLLHFNWTSTGPLLHRYWTSTGPLLDLYWDSCWNLKP